MILKEAFRYQNYLSRLIGEAIDYLTTTSNVVITKQEHLKSKSNADAEDEVVIADKYSDIEYKPNQVIDFLLDVLNEKEKLSDAINKAKLNTEINIDSSIAINKEKQRITSIFDRLSKTKSGEKIRNDSDYKFNAEGNQVSYYYEVKETTTIDFDRNKVKGIVKRLRRESDNTSNELDRVQVTLEVDYSPTYEINDDFEDSLEIFVNK